MYTKIKLFILTFLLSLFFWWVFWIYVDLSPTKFNWYDASLFEASLDIGFTWWFMSWDKYVKYNWSNNPILSKQRVTSFLKNPNFPGGFTVLWTWSFKNRDFFFDIDNVTELKNFSWTVEEETWKINQWYIFVKPKNSSKYKFIDAWYDSIGWRDIINQSIANLGHNKWVYIRFMSYFYNISLYDWNYIWDSIVPNIYSVRPDDCYKRSVWNSNTVIKWWEILCVDKKWYITYLEKYWENANMTWYYFNWITKFVDDYNKPIAPLKKFVPSQIERNNWYLKWYQSTYNQYQVDKLQEYYNDIILAKSAPYVDFVEQLQWNTWEQLLNNITDHPVKLKAWVIDPDDYISKVVLYKNWQKFWELNSPDIIWWDIYSFIYNPNRVIWKNYFSWVVISSYWLSSSTQDFIIEVLANKPPEVLLSTPVNWQTFDVSEKIYILGTWTDEDWYIKKFKYYYKNENSSSWIYLWENSRTSESQSFWWVEISNWLSRWVYDVIAVWEDDMWEINTWKNYKIYVWPWSRYANINSNFNWNWKTECMDDWDSPKKRWMWDLNDPKCAWDPVVWNQIWPKIWWNQCYVDPLKLPTLNWNIICWYWDWEKPEVTANHQWAINSWINYDIRLMLTFNDFWGSKLKNISYKVYFDWEDRTNEFLWNWFSLNTTGWAYKWWLNVNSYVVDLWKDFTEEWVRSLDILSYDNSNNKLEILNSNYQIKIDKVIPPITDITSITLDWNFWWQNSYANSDWSIELKLHPTCLRKSCSSIKKIYFRKEKFSDKNSYIDTTIDNIWCSYKVPTSSNCKVKTNWNVSLVDGNDFDSSKLWRDYNLKLMIEDEWWNKTSWQDYTWWVFPNLYISQHSELQDIDTKTTSWILWNWEDSYYRSFVLKDSYWNLVNPANQIGRKVYLNYNYKNTVYLDQYLLNKREDNKSWIITYFKNDSEKKFLNMDSYNWTLEKDYSQSSNIINWVYSWSFRSYVPTYFNDQYNKFYNWVFLLYNIWYRIEDNPALIYGSWSYYTQWVALDRNWWYNVRFNPSLYTKIKWLPPLALEWVSKKFTVDVIKPVSSNINLSDDWVKLKVSYNLEDPFSTYINSYLKNFWTSKWNSCITKITSNWNDSEPYLDCYESFGSLFTPYSLTSSNQFEEKFVLKPWYKLSSSSTWWTISTHLSVKYDDGIIWVWNWDLVWKSNYNYDPNNDLTYEELFKQNSITIFWMIWWSDYSKFNSISSSQQRDYWGTKEKFELNSEIRNKVSVITKWNSLNLLSDKDNYFDVFNNPNKYSYFKVKDTKVYYFKSDIESNIILPWKIWFNDKILIISEWINVYITWDIQYLDNWKIWIVALNTTNWWSYKWWNIFVKNDITNLNSFIFANWALISYAWEIWWSDYQTQESMTQKELNNQLYIKWVMWTSNTLWSSRSQTAKCPYFVSETCTSEVAQRYDIEYIRRFFLTSVSEYSWNDVTSNVYINYWFDDEKPSKFIWWIECNFDNDNSNWTWLDVICTDKNSSLNNLLGSTMLNSYNPFNINDKNIIRYTSPLVLEYDSTVKDQLPIFWF